MQVPKAKRYEYVCKECGRTYYSIVPNQKRNLCNTCQHYYADIFDSLMELIKEDKNET